MAVQPRMPSDTEGPGDGWEPSITEGTVVPLARHHSAYYVIDKIERNGRDVYRVWHRSGEHPVATLLGEFATVDEAKTSMPVHWRPATGALEAWALGSSHARLRQTPDAAADVPNSGAEAPDSVPGA